MRLIQRTVSVHFNHRVFFSERVFDPQNLLLQSLLTESKAPAKALIVLDQGLAAAQPALTREIETYFASFGGHLVLVSPPMMIEGGERAKASWSHVSEIHAQIERHHIDRQSYVLAVGGGAVLDVAGLAAATAHRGVRHIRIPTTVLGQNDAGVGIKNGINAFGKKNFIGSFAPPHAVVNDFTLLATLPAPDKRAGYAEAVKVALIRDADFFAELENAAPALARFEDAALRPLIERCAESHVRHIADSGDPFETGSARPLDFGHWAAHKLEQLSNYRLRHGEAVAVGMAVDVLYSRNIGWLDPAACARILRMLDILGFDLSVNELFRAGNAGQSVLLQGLEEFREHLGGDLSLTMLRAIGQSAEVHEVDLPRMTDAIAELAQRREIQDRHPVPAQV